MIFADVTYKKCFDKHKKVHNWTDGYHTMISFVSQLHRGVSIRLFLLRYEPFQFLLTSVQTVASKKNAQGGQVRIFQKSNVRTSQTKNQKFASTHFFRVAVKIRFSACTKSFLSVKQNIAAALRKKNNLLYFIWKGNRLTKTFNFSNN